MKAILLATLTIGIWVPLVPQQSGQPVKGIAESNRAARANEAQKSNQDQQSAETEAIQGILAQITQIQQQHTQELKDAENQKNQDADISGKIKTYTFWLIIVGGIQALILAGTVWAIIRQTTTMRNSERAWIMVDIEMDSERRGIVEGTRGNGNVLEHSTNVPIICACRNQGNSPAWIFNKRINFEIVDAIPKIPRLESTELLQAELEPLAAGRDSVIRRDCDAVGRLEVPKIGIIYGIVEYRDIFGRSRITTFGYAVTMLNAILPKRLERITGFPEYNKNT
jgi:hypothetical protein